MALSPSVRTLILGLLSWAIPFAASLLFYGSDGVLKVSQPLFNAVMVVVGGGSGAWLIVLAFRRMTANVVNGVLIGLCWAALNLALDWIFLVPMMRLSEARYLGEIGLQYALMPIMAAAIGAAVADKQRDRFLSAAAHRAFGGLDRIPSQAQP